MVLQADTPPGLKTHGPQLLVTWASYSALQESATCHLVWSEEGGSSRKPQKKLVDTHPGDISWFAFPRTEF